MGIAYPAVDESLDRLHRAGWSVGDHGSGTRRTVAGSTGRALRVGDPGFGDPRVGWWDGGALLGSELLPC
jgi:hypothetical protein